MPTKKKTPPKFLVIPLGIWKCGVVVTWETTIEKIVEFGIQNKLNVNPDWEKDVAKGMRRGCGLCVHYGDHEADLLVWLKTRPRKLSEFGVLYHELHHAVEFLAKDKAMEAELEAKAYTYEYLAIAAQRRLWRAR